MQIARIVGLRQGQPLELANECLGCRFSGIDDLQCLRKIV